MNSQGIGRKAGALALAAALALLPVVGGLTATPALADTGSVTISRINASDEYHIYQLFTADVEEDENGEVVASNFAWGSELLEGNDYTKVDSLVSWLRDWEGNTYDDFLNFEDGATDNEKTEARRNPQNAAEFISERISAGKGENASSWTYAQGNAFAEALAEFVESTDDGLGLTGTTTSGGVATDLETGYYLITSASVASTGGDVATYPIWETIASGTNSITVKAQAATVEKHIVTTVDGSETQTLGTSAQIGDSVTFEVAATIPSTYSNYDEFKLSITDTPDPGLVIDQSSVRVYAGSVATANDVTSSFDVSVEASTNDSGQLVHTLTVSSEDITDIELASGAPAFAANTVVRVRYDATVTNVDGGLKSGSDANYNGVSYTFSNDPSSTGTGTVNPAVTPKVYTFRVALAKVDASTEVALDGAEFVVWTGDATSPQYLRHSKVTSGSDSYIEAKWDGTWDTSTGTGTATVFVANEDGTLTPKNDDATNGGTYDTVDTIVGLAAGTYHITEVKAPDGYILPSTGTDITITAGFSDTDGTIASFGATVTGDNATRTDATTVNDGQVDITVTNTKNVGLASTGGLGVGIAGVVVLTVGITWYAVRRRRAANEG